MYKRTYFAKFLSFFMSLLLLVLHFNPYFKKKVNYTFSPCTSTFGNLCAFTPHTAVIMLHFDGEDDVNYNGNRLRLTPRDRENVLTLSEVDLIHIMASLNCSRC